MRTTQPQRLGTLFKNLQVICVGTRVDAFSANDRVTKFESPDVKYLEPKLVTHFRVLMFQALQVKSLILAQIERWRRA